MKPKYLKCSSVQISSIGVPSLTQHFFCQPFWDRSGLADTDGDAGSGFGGAGAGFGVGLGKTGTGSRVGCKTAGFLSGSDATNTWNQKQRISMHWYKNSSTRRLRLKLQFVHTTENT